MTISLRTVCAFSAIGLLLSGISSRANTGTNDVSVSSLNLREVGISGLCLSKNKQHLAYIVRATNSI
ncbi:MAG: hypothetical protein SGJ05_04510 [bacterium]|nr:hypothetical protein [bacterium]